MQVKYQFIDTLTGLEDFAKWKRPLRQDDPDTLGIPTTEMICEAIDNGHYEEAKSLARYTITEGKALHDLMCDWVWHFLTLIADRHGEEEMIVILRASQESWMMKRTWKAFLNLTVAERVQVTAEIGRSHYCGPNQDGSIEISEDADRFTLKMDPCGSGGRMRRGNPVNGDPSRLEAPYNFGCTQEAHPWSLGQKEVPYYCAHCAIH